MATYNPLYVKYLMDNFGALWFKFDETSPTSVIDSKGSNVGVVTGTSIVSGVSGNARSFNGTSDFIRFTGNSLIPTGKKSVRFRFRAPFVTSSINRYLFSNFDTSSSQQGFGIFITPTGNLTVVGANGTGNLYRYNLSTPASVCDNLWHDVLFTWDGTTSANTVKLYVDEMKTPVTQTTSTSVEPATYFAAGSSIGRLGGNATTSNLRCDLDEFEVYNEVIDPIAYKFLISSEDAIVTVIDDGIKLLPSILEKDYVNHGMPKNYNVDINTLRHKKQIVKSTSEILGSGKIFKQKIDTTKIPIKKASIT